MKSLTTPLIKKNSLTGSLSAYLKQPPLGKIRLHTMRHDLAKGQVMARSMFPTPPEISFYPVFRQTPRPDSPELIISPFLWFSLPREERHIAGIWLLDALARGRNLAIFPDGPDHNLLVVQRCYQDKPPVRRNGASPGASAIELISLDPLNLTWC